MLYRQIHLRKWVIEPAIKQTNKEAILQALRLKLADKESTAEKN
jgi:hypothetical protein